VDYRKVEGAAPCNICPTCTTPTLSLVNSLLLLPALCPSAWYSTSRPLRIFRRAWSLFRHCRRHQSAPFTMSTPHVFRQLDKKTQEIRLLHLHAILPSREEGGTKSVAAHFSYTSLANDQHEKFMALSYVWGEANYLSNVVLDDGSHVTITENLLVAIEHLFATGFAPVSCTSAGKS